MSVNDWQKQFGAARRAIDRRILAEAEAAIGLEGLDRPPVAKNQERPPAGFSEAPDDARLAIARAFGRPLK
jgi:hypothetical protein